MGGSTTNQSLCVSCLGRHPPFHQRIMNSTEAAAKFAAVPLAKLGGVQIWWWWWWLLLLLLVVLLLLLLLMAGGKDCLSLCFEMKLVYG